MTGTTNRSRSNPLLTLQLFVLLIQVSIPLLYLRPSSSWSSIGVEIGQMPPQPQQLRNRPHPPPADESEVAGYFNGVPVTYVAASSSSPPLHSTAHCIGETFAEKSWVHRSCEYRNLCFDLEEMDFVLFRSPDEADLSEALKAHDMARGGLLTVSSALGTTVSLGGINDKWTWKEGAGGEDAGAPALEWAPRILDKELNEAYYMLPESAVLLPFHSMAAINVGHLIWDDFLPMYTLLSTFNLIDDRHHAMPLRYVLKNRDRALWATCNLRDKTLAECKGFFKKFLPLMGVEPSTMRSTEDSVLNTTTAGGGLRSRYVCGAKAAAGIGMLTDHGLKPGHGWDKRDYDLSHNAGRGPVLNEFRNWMVRNLGLDPTETVRRGPPYRIIFAVQSSKDRDRRVDFSPQIKALEQAFGSTVTIESINFADKPVLEQVRLAMESSVIVGVCGGGAVTNMFMSQGSGMVLYYSDRPSGKQHDFPARLDFDYFNNAGYARVHWMPISSMQKQTDIEVFVKLIKNEIETISHH